jgi:hypothetical protein
MQIDFHRLTPDEPLWKSWSRVQNHELLFDSGHRGLRFSCGRRGDGKHFPTVWRWAGHFLVANIEDRRALGQLHAAVDQIGYGDPAGYLGRQKDHWEEILFALDQRLGDTVDRVAAVNAARHLRNDEGSHRELGVLFTVTDQRAGDLFGGHQTDIGDEVAMDCMGQVDVEDDAGEVGAVVEEEVEVADVAAVVVGVDEALVLCRRAVDLKAVDSAIVGGADQFGPLTLGGPAVAVIGRQIKQVLLTVGVAQSCDLFFVHRLGNVGQRIDGVEIGDQRDGEPVIPINLVVAADDDAILSVVARAEHGGGISANVIEINGGVASGVYCAKIAVRLFHQECDGGVGVRSCCREETEK